MVIYTVIASIAIVTLTQNRGSFHQGTIFTGNPGTRFPQDALSLIDRISLTGNYFLSQELIYCNKNQFLGTRKN